MALIAGARAVLGLVHLARLPTKPAITLCVFAVGLPAALTYVSESGGLQLGVLLREMWRWRWSAQALRSHAERASARACVVLASAEGPAETLSGRGSMTPRSRSSLSEERWG